MPRSTVLVRLKWPSNTSLNDSSSLPNEPNLLGCTTIDSTPTLSPQLPTPSSTNWNKNNEALDSSIISSSKSEQDESADNVKDVPLTFNCSPELNTDLLQKSTDGEVNLDSNDKSDSLNRSLVKNSSKSRIRKKTNEQKKQSSKTMSQLEGNSLRKPSKPRVKSRPKRLSSTSRAERLSRSMSSTYASVSTNTDPNDFAQLAIAATLPRAASKHILPVCAETASSQGCYTILSPSCSSASSYLPAETKYLSSFKNEVQEISRKDNQNNPTKIPEMEEVCPTTDDDDVKNIVQESILLPQTPSKQWNVFGNFASKVRKTSQNISSKIKFSKINSSNNQKESQIELKSFNQISPFAESDAKKLESSDENIAYGFPKQNRPRIDAISSAFPYEKVNESPCRIRHAPTVFESMHQEFFSNPTQSDEPNDDEHEETYRERGPDITESHVKLATPDIVEFTLHTCSHRQGNNSTCSSDPDLYSDTNNSDNLSNSKFVNASFDSTTSDLNSSELLDNSVACESDITEGMPQKKKSVTFKLPPEYWDSILSLQETCK